MSLTAPHWLGAAGPRRSGPRGTLAIRARVFLRRGTLDGLLAAGADPSWDAELRLRAAQVIAPSYRIALAESLERAIREAHRPPRWSCAAPLDRRAVRGAAPELGTLAAGLTARVAPAAEGVALAAQLMRDPDSPLFAPGDEESLRDGAQIAWRALG